ncbi:hypothetical protein B0H14DRAFT_1351645 [Mycena olivaceomarginata]|nr:hypothetical protein B0H14DRAFT_1351645 [Mycena olivaceomarginata]
MIVSETRRPSFNVIFESRRCQCARPALGPSHVPLWLKIRYPTLALNIVSFPSRPLCVRYSPNSGPHIPTRYAHVGTEQLRAYPSVLAKAELTAPAKPRRTSAFNGSEISVDHISTRIGMRGTFTADGGANIIPVISSRRVLPNFEAEERHWTPRQLMRSTSLRHQLTTATPIPFTLATLCADKYHGGII